MQKLLFDYGICQKHLTIYCDNTNAINISKNPTQHSRTKHIEIRHHFIRELIEDGTLTLEFIHTDDQKDDLFTKPLDGRRFEFLRQNIGVISMDRSLSLSRSPLPHAYASSFDALSACLFGFFFFFFEVFLIKKIKKIQKQYVFVYIGTCVPWMAFETKFLNFVSFVS